MTLDHSAGSTKTFWNVLCGCRHQKASIWNSSVMTLDLDGGHIVCEMFCFGIAVCEMFCLNLPFVLSLRLKKKKSSKGVASTDPSTTILNCRFFAKFCNDWPGEWKAKSTNKIQLKHLSYWWSSSSMMMMRVMHCVPTSSYWLQQHQANTTAAYSSAKFTSRTGV